MLPHQLLLEQIRGRRTLSEWLRCLVHYGVSEYWTRHNHPVPPHSSRKEPSDHQKSEEGINHHVRSWCQVGYSPQFFVTRSKLTSSTVPL